MIRNFFTTAWRNFYRHSGFSFINMAGLTMGLTACLLIGLFVWDEKQYDRLPGADSVYRIYDQRTDNQGTSPTPRTPPMFASTLQQQFPEVASTLRVMDIQFKTLFEVDDKKFYEEGGLAVEPAFFDMFPLPLKYGTKSGLLDETRTIVITDDLSNKYFGNQNPVGKEIIINKLSWIVSGVVLNSKVKFHLKLNYIIPMAVALKDFQVSDERMQSWSWQQFVTYVKLKPGANDKHLQSAFQELIKLKVDPILKPGGMTYVPFLQSLKDIHLYSSGFKLDNAVKGNITYVNALSIIALSILLIACFNFINLSTASSLQRAREVGVRKSIGASKRQLLFQFTGETILLSTACLVLSVGLTVLLIPGLNRFAGKEIPQSLFYNPLLLLLLLASAMVVGIIAGFYPALVLSGFQPVKVLKGMIVNNVRPGRIPWLRQGLVVIQFSLSVLLIISAIIVFRQVNYLHNKNLGLNKDQVMFFPLQGDNMFKNYASFKNELLKSPGVSDVSIGYGFPGDIFAGDQVIVPKDGNTTTYPVTQLLVDEDYVKTLGLTIMAGRDFSKAITTDKDAAFIINETAVKELGYRDADKAVGQPLQWKVWDSKTPDSLKRGLIIGVVRDFNYKSLYEKIEPAVIQIYPDAYWKVAVKIKSASISSAIAGIKNVWSRFSPFYPIEYTFIDENFRQMYTAEDKLKTLLSLFTVIAIFVGCLGLFGLAAYSAHRRTKEIGVRKVLGANVQSILILLSKDFVKPVLIALVIASPLAAYFMRGWLQDFAYRINIGWTVFALAGGAALVIALVTVSFQAIRAAISNPVKSLRTE